MQLSSSPRLVAPRFLLRSFWPTLLMSLLLLALALPLSAAPAAWGLDPTFGNGGKVITDTGARETASDALIQADGKLVVVGSILSDTGTSTSYDFLLMRYTRDGTLDTSFDGDGIVATDLFGGDDNARAVAQQADGKFVVVGDASNTGGMGVIDFVVARYNVDGTLDTDFGGDGSVVIDYNRTIDRAYDVVVQNDQKLIVVGVTNNLPNSPPGSQMMMVRYNSNGTVDTDFGDAGKVVTGFGMDRADVGSVALQSDGKIVIGGVLGRNGSPPTADQLVARYNVNGVLDDTFSEDGVVTVDFNGRFDTVAGLLIQEDKIVAVGTSINHANGSTSNVILTRFTSNGELDPTFDNDGKVMTGPSEGEQVGISSVIIHDGGYMLLGSMRPNPGNSPAMLLLERYHADGSTDTSFGSNGRLVTDFGERYNASPTELVPQDGKVVAIGTGSQQDTVDYDVLLARYQADAPPPPPPYDHHLWLPFVRRE